MQYVVHEVDELPEGLTHVIMKRPDAPPVLVLTGEVARCWRLMRAWEDVWEPCAMPSVTFPAQHAGALLRAVS